MPRKFVLFLTSVLIMASLLLSVPLTPSSAQSVDETPVPETGVVTTPEVAVTPETTTDAPAAAAGDFKIEINQAIGVQVQNHTYYTAGKPTVILAYLNTEAKVDEANTQAVIIRDGTTVTTLKPKTAEQAGKVVEFLCPDMTACGDWQKGKYEFEVTVNGSKVKSEAYDFIESKDLRVLAVPVKAKYGQTVTQVQGEGWKSMDDFTKYTYPVGSANFKWVVRDEIDASANDLETDEGRLALWQQLAGLVPNECQANPAADGCYEMVVGFISDRPNGYPNGNLQGYTYGLPATIVVASDEDAKATVAHEIAHVYGVGDTYQGGSINCSVNPAPDGMAGKDWDDRSKDTSCTQGAKQFSETVSATIIDAATVHPYEVGGRGVLPDSACFMGSGGKQENYWVTAETYDKLFSSLAKTTQTANTNHLASAKPAPVEKPMLYFFGYIKEDGTFISEPWYTFDGTDMEAVPASPSGTPVTIKVLDAKGKELAVQNEKVEFYPNTAPGTPIVKVDEAPLEGVIDFPAGAKSVQVVFKGKVVKEITVSANKPVVSDVTPISAAQKLDGPYKVTWKGSDADKDTLSYIVEFNPDTTNSESEWDVLADGLTTPEWEEDLSQWSGGAHAQFRVTASDGLLSSEAVSKEFTVPFKAPEVTVYDPEWGTEYAEDDEIALSGDAYDMQDEWLQDKALVWTSDKVKEPLGYGEEIVISLPVGTHTITLTAKNSNGASAKAVLEKKITVK